MITLPIDTPDYSALLDFARLSPQRALVIVREPERDAEVLQLPEFILKRPASFEEKRNPIS